MIRPLYHRDIRFLLCSRNDSLILTWIVATIGGRRTGGDDERAITWGYEEVDEERDFLRREMVLGSESFSLRVRPILLHPPRISQGNEAAAPTGWYGAKHLDSARDGVSWEWALSWEIETWKECLNPCA